MYGDGSSGGPTTGVIISGGGAGALAYTGMNTVAWILLGATVLFVGLVVLRLAKRASHQEGKATVKYQGRHRSGMKPALATAGADENWEPWR